MESRQVRRHNKRHQIKVLSSLNYPVAKVREYKDFTKTYQSNGEQEISRRLKKVVDNPV